MKKLMIVRSQTAWAGLALLLASAVSSSAAVLHVPADYPTIQGAVDAAVSGDQIRIAAGTYTEQVVIASKNLKLIGEPGAVLEAWPVEQDAWTVESATNVVGPWTPSDATHFLQRGQHSIAVPTDGERRLFRLINQ